MTNQEEIKRLKRHMEQHYDEDSEIMTLSVILSEGKLFFDTTSDTLFDFSIDPDEQSTLYIYVLDNGRGLFVDKREMNFPEAFEQMEKQSRGFNYMRRIAVINGKVSHQTLLTPNHPDGE